MSIYRKQSNKYCDNETVTFMNENKFYSKLKLPHMLYYVNTTMKITGEKLRKLF